MKELLEHWLDARVSVPGMVACGVVPTNMLAPGAGPGDAEGLCRSTDANFTTHQMAQVLRVLQATPIIPDSKPSDVKWRTWVFSNGKIRSAVRPDGWLFAAIVIANSDGAQILDPLTEEFLALKQAE